MKTFQSLNGSYFHTLSFVEQLVVLQNSVCELWGAGVAKPLTASEVRKEEFRDVFYLFQPQFAGPFASTELENSYAWRGYVYDISEQEEARFERAIKLKLWRKYTGQIDWESHIMGQIMHTVNSIGEAWFKPTDVVRKSASPGLHAQAYGEILSQMIYARNILVIGAFSPISVADLWIIKSRFAPMAKLQIIDINTGLAQMAALHYNIEFTEGDGLCSLYPNESFDAILTNHLVPFLEGAYNPDSVYKERKKLFAECYRLLRPQGKMILVEPPLVIDDMEMSGDLQCLIEKERLGQSLIEVGFDHNEITNAQRFKNRALVDAFVRNPHEISPKHLTVDYADKTVFRIVATK